MGAKSSKEQALVGPASIERAKASVLNSKLYVEIRSNQCPIVYTSEYNIFAFGLEKLHPLDSKKWGRVYEQLISSGRLSAHSVVKPVEATIDDLLVVHTREYLDSLKSSSKLCLILEVPIVACLPNCLVDSCVLRPMRYHVGGTILAAKLALERGWAINIGGGMHHASANNGGGFCVYADITLAIKFLFHSERITRALIVDLDAHQGNGHERDFMGDNRVYIMDMFNSQIYPNDYEARAAINRPVRLRSGTGDIEYLGRLTKELSGALDDFPAQLLVYNAGTDLLSGDPLGLLRITPEGVVRRDELVFHMARQHNIPIVMVTSGGYTSGSARVIGDSILNLHDRNLIQLT